MRILAPLRLPQLALLWVGLTLSAIGDQLYAVALSWIAVGVLGTAAGYLTALGAATILLTAMLGGHWTDRWEQRRAMIGADVVRAVALMALVASWFLLRRPPAIGLAAVVVVLACGQAVFRPALQALLPALVSQVRLLPATNALFDATERIARLLGPGLVGLLAALIPTMHFLSLDAVSFLASAAALMLIRRVFAVTPLRQHGPRGGLPAAVARGFQVLRQHPLLGFMLAVSGATNGLWYATIFLGLPLIIVRHGVIGPGGTGLAAYGLVISAYGCTNLLGTLIVGGCDLPANPAPLIFSGKLVTGGGIALMGLAEALALPHALLLPAYVAAAGVTAFGGPMGDIPSAVLQQSELPRADLPAATRAFMVVNYTGMLLAMLAAPLLFATLPAGIVIGGSGLAIVAIGLAGLMRFAGRAVPRDDPARRPAGMPRNPSPPA